MHLPSRLFAVRSTRAHSVCWVTCWPTRPVQRSRPSTYFSKSSAPPWRHRTSQRRRAATLYGRSYRLSTTSRRPKNVFSASSTTWSPSSSKRTTVRAALSTPRGHWRASAPRERLVRWRSTSSRAKMFSFISLDYFVRSFRIRAISLPSSQTLSECWRRPSTR